MAYPGPDPDTQPDDTPAENPGGDEAAPDAGNETTATGNRVTLDMTNPDNAEALKGCEPGETLTMESKDGTSAVFSKGEGYDESEAPAGEDEKAGEEPPKGAVAILMAKKMKR